MSDVIVLAAPGSSAEDIAASNYEWNPDSLTSTIKGLFSKAGNSLEIRPGLYKGEGEIEIGSNVTVRGSRAIAIPAVKSTILEPNPSTMAVFSSKRTAAATSEKGSYTFRLRSGWGSTGILLEDLYQAGYVDLKLQGVKNVTIRRCVSHNYHSGAYPNGVRANMGYGRTGAFWITGNTDTVLFDQCVSQFSSHHGFLNHGSLGYWYKNLTYKDCRALYSGSGMLRGEGDQIARSIAQMPQTQGYGWTDWSCAFDLCEAGNIDNVLLEDCYALSGWKTGFYLEPRWDGHKAEHYRLVLRRCVAEDAGQRASAKYSGESRALMIVRESEASNFYLDAGDLYDCISRRGFKAGYYLHAEGMPQNAAKGHTRNMIVQGCTDCGSMYGFYFELPSRKVTFANNSSYNALNRALMAYKGEDFKATNFRIVSQTPTKSPVMFGRGCLMRKALSRYPSWQTEVAGRMANERTTTTGLTLGGTVGGLQAGTPVFEIANGAVVNGAGRGVIPSGVSLSRVTDLEVPALCTSGYSTSPPPEDPEEPVEEPVIPEVPTNPVVPGVVHYVGFSALTAAPLEVRPGEWITIYLRPTVENGEE